MRIYKATRPGTADITALFPPEDLRIENNFSMEKDTRFTHRIFLLLPDTLEERISLSNFFEQRGHKGPVYGAISFFPFFGSRTSVSLDKEVQDLIYELGGPTLQSHTLIVLSDNLCRKNGTISYEQDDTNKPSYAHYAGIDYRVIEQIWPTNKTSKKENTNGDA